MVRPSWIRAMTGGWNARSTAVRSPSMAMPADGTSTPGSVPPPVTDTVDTGVPTPRASARCSRSATGTVAIRQNGKC